jgi:signal transduction histidine kinase
MKRPCARAGAQPAAHNDVMTNAADGPTARWFRSFYVRIGFTFVIFVVAVVIAQNVIFGYVLSRTATPAFPGRSPNNLAAIVAADVGSALAQDRNLDVEDYVRRDYAEARFLFVLMKDGRLAANSSQRLDEGVRRSVEAALRGTTFGRGGEPRIEGPPTVTAPIQVAGELRGMVILPPTAPGSPVVRDLTRMLSLPGTIVLIVATTIAAAFIFAPARRRLEALEAATDRLGRGDLAARAPESGGDEIARVARAFNRMAGELTMRDDALRASDRLRRQMLADISHELKTPLTAMRGYLETLHMAEVELDADTRERYFTTIERETLRLDRIVQDLLDLARLESGAGTMQVRLFSMRRLFEHVVRRHEHEARVREIALRVNVADDADQVTADPDRLEQVIENLFANALRHTPAGGTIELSAAMIGETLVARVVDSGEGIAAEHLPHVFERFYKADAARAAAAAGSGLGLSIAKAIVERHQGSIGAASTPGRTEFTLRLPQGIERPAQLASANL